MPLIFSFNLKCFNSVFVDNHYSTHFFPYQHLSRRLDEAQHMNESRVKLMEQIESNSEELSRSHIKLKKETQSIWEHNQILTESVESLVEKCDHYKTEMENLRMANVQLQHQLSTTQNFVEQKAPEECEPVDYERDVVEKEVRKLSVAIQELKIEQEQEKSTREELEYELSQLIIQNENLGQKLQYFAKGSSNRNSYVEDNERDSINNEKEVEEVIEEDGSCLDDSFVLVELQDIEELDSDVSHEQCDISFLDELDQQYRELVTKYNALLEKCKTEGIPYESREMCMVQRGMQTSETGEDGSGIGKGVPEYKKMFAIIYEKLREGRND